MPLPLLLLNWDCSIDTGGGVECGRFLRRVLGEEALAGGLGVVVAVDLGGWDVRRGVLKRRERLLGGGGESVRERGRGCESVGWEVMVGWRARSGLEWA